MTSSESPQCEQQPKETTPPLPGPDLDAAQRQAFCQRYVESVCRSSTPHGRVEAPNAALLPLSGYVHHAAWRAAKEDLRARLGMVGAEAIRGWET
ncbi:hypothetical protein JCM10213v2_005415 [Rhodosporidiobolus nylandii]